MHKSLKEKNIVANVIIQMTEVKIKFKKNGNTCIGLENPKSRESHKTKGKSLIIIDHLQPTKQN